MGEWKFESKALRDAAAQAAEDRKPVLDALSQTPHPQEANMTAEVELKPPMTLQEEVARANPSPNDRTNQ